MTVLQPADVAARKFPSVRLKEGYDIEAVDGFLTQVAHSLTTLHDTVTDRESALADAHQVVAALETKVESLETQIRTQAPPLPPLASPEQTPSAAASLLLEMAQRTAEETIATANAEADTTLTTARDEAAQARAAAQEEADSTVATARDEASRLLDDARAEQQRVLADLYQQRDRLVSDIDALADYEQTYKTRLRDELDRVTAGLDDPRAATLPVEIDPAPQFTVAEPDSAPDLPEATAQPSDPEPVATVPLTPVEIPIPVDTVDNPDDTDSAFTDTTVVFQPTGSLGDDPSDTGSGAPQFTDADAVARELADWEAPLTPPQTNGDTQPSWQ